MKKVLGYLIDNPRRAAIALIAVLVTGGAAWILLINPAVVGMTPFEKNAPKAKTIPPGPSLPDYSKTAEANFLTEDASRPSAGPALLTADGARPQGAVQQLTLETPTTAPATTVLILVGQYCQGGKPFANYQFATVFTTSIDWSGPGDEGPEESVDFVYGKKGITYYSPEGTGLELSSPPEANPGIKMSCALSATKAHEALLTCTGPQDSTVPILVGGILVDVSFMGCDKPEREPKPDEACTRRDCR